MPIERRRPDASLFKHDGTEFPGTTIVRNLNVSYDRRYPEIVVFADNTRGFSEIGDPQPHIDSFTLDCFRRAAVTQIKDHIAREGSHGLFTLEVPDLDQPEVDLYHIRFFEAEFTPESPRNSTTQLYRAQITDIEVLRHDRVAL